MSTALPKYPISTIHDLETLEIKGPWATKSGGKLHVLFALPYEVLESRYFKYEDEELASIPGDIRGLRIYSVGEMPKGSIGAREVHKVRHELAIAIEGSVRWTCEDVHGEKREFILDGKTAIWTPPYVLHTYEALEDNTRLVVVANTLFDPEESKTHDSFGEEEFRRLQTLAK